MSMYYRGHIYVGNISLSSKNPPSTNCGRIIFLTIIIIFYIVYLTHIIVYNTVKYPDDIEIVNFDITITLSVPCYYIVAFVILLIKFSG